MITLTATIRKLDNTKINLTARNLLSIERSIFERKDIDMPSWGIVSNSGNISFADSDGSIKKLADERKLKSGMKVEMFLNNTTLKTQQPVGVFFTNGWDYDATNKEVKVSLQDELQLWQSFSISNIEYDASKSKEEQMLNGKGVYDAILSEMQKSGYDISKFEELDANTLSHLKRFTLPYPYFEAQTFWSVWTNFCVAMQLHIYINNNAKIVVKYNGGN